MAVIGTSCSSEARAAEPLLSKAGFVTVSASNTAADLTEAGNPNNYPGYLRTAYNDNVQGAVAADYVYNVLKLGSAATIHDGSLYAKGLQQIFSDRFRKLGGTITDQAAVDPSQLDMSSVLTEIAASKPAIIYMPLSLPAGALVIQQAGQQEGLQDTVLMGADALFGADDVKDAGAAIDGFRVSSPLVSGPAYDAFVLKYKARFGISPITAFDAHAYDAFGLLKAAIEKVATVDPDGTMHIGRQALRDAMYATRGYSGLTGVLSCTPTGDCANPVIAVYQYHGQKYPPDLVWQPNP